MTSDRIRSHVERLLTEADEALVNLDWGQVKVKAEAVLDLDPDNRDAPAILAAADRAQARSGQTAPAPAASPASPPPGSTPQPTSFANGRYTVKRFLGEGGKKKVYLAQDALLDRDVAFALIKTEGLDEASRTRITREAQAMGRLGDHPNIVTVYDIGSEGDQPYMVLPVLAGGDVEGVIEKAPEQRMPLERALKIAIETCRGLEFAHGKGIVHRDLKPGNVWLAEDGTAKIGDFGLAVATDRSRLTQAGMMVGTVSYMPPEQAMGGEVGPRSDLYSLGAMLYEMVCGRPPFVGDESVAIIGQHLNTPPVAPSWHRPDCPPSLEALILRLLEKDPSKRPTSATEVREALESVTTSATSRQPTVAQELPAGDNPLYRRTFVGREAELKQVQSAFDAALSGQGGLVMVVGEPGIGKTAICEQLATYVALRGGKALVGHCYEEGSLSLPYLAFVEAMRSYVLAREPDGLRSDLGTGAADVARIVSEVRDRVQGVELRTAGDPEDDRWRLLQAITSFLRNASTVQPLCIVLEDLHWADRGTLDLLLQVSRNLQGARLLIVGTYRDVEVDRAHPLSGVLADLRRGANFSRVPLRGLTVDEVHRMYQALRGNEVPWAQAEAVHRATEGNPLFVQEVLRYLVEEGFVVREGGRYVAQQGAGDGIPEGLRDVVGKRLNRLGEKANQVLTVASVIGREFRLDVLQGVAGLTEEDLYSALEEAQERAIIEQAQILGALGFRFTHAFFRQTLYEEIFAPRRIRLHQQVARSLESVHGRRLEEHAAELVEHYAQSVDSADLEKAIQYGKLAAQRALSVFDYGEAARHLEQALKALEVLNQDDRAGRCDLLTDLAEVLNNGGEPRRALDVVEPEALDLAEALNDRLRASRVCRLAIDSFHAAAANREWDTPAALRWAEAADRASDPDTLAKVVALGALGRVNVVAGNTEQGRKQLLQAVELARRLGDNQTFWLAAMMWSETVNTNAGLATIAEVRDEALRLANEVSHRPREGVSALIQRTAFFFMIGVFFGAGQRDKAEAIVHEIRALADHTKQPNLELTVLYRHAWLLTLDGKLEEALEMCEILWSRAEELGLMTYIAAFAQGLRVRIFVLLGRPSSAFWQPAAAALRALQLASEGFEVEARQIVSQAVSGRDAGFLLWLPALEAAVVTKHEEAVRAGLAALEGISLPVALHGLALCVPRVLGDAFVFIRDYGSARREYERAVEVTKAMRIRPESALTRLSLAELLLQHYPDEHDTAIEHLDFAIAELRDMKMQPALERALRHRGLLKA